MDDCCQHNKIYSGEYFACIPPKWVWVCSRCGKTGTDQMQEKPFLDFVKYMQLTGNVFLRKIVK
jgi:hypothetical protein